MKMNRRNVLVGLGGIVASGGALLGTGAFSSVEADRTANFDVSNDDSALLTLEGDGTYVTGSSSGTIKFEFTNLNDNAVTTFDDVLTITNNTQDSADKDVHIHDDGDVAPNEIIDFHVSDDSQSGTSGDSIVGSSNAVTVSDTQSVSLDIEIDAGAGDPSSVSSVTIVAEDV